MNLRSRGKSITFFGLTSAYRQDKRPYREDLPILFKLLEEGKLKPVIMTRIPLLQAMRANDLLESGQVIGNVVLVAAEA